MSPYVYPGLKISIIDGGKCDLHASIIISKVLKYRGHSIDNLKELTKKTEIVYTRQLCMYFLKKYTLLSYEKIAERSGRGDHTTAIKGIRHVKAMFDTEQPCRMDRDNLEKILNNQYE